MLDDRLSQAIAEKFLVYWPRTPWLARLLGIDEYIARAYGVGFCDGAQYLTDRVETEGAQLYVLLSSVEKIMAVCYTMNEAWNSQRDMCPHDLEAMGCTVRPCSVVLR